MKNVSPVKIWRKQKKIYRLLGKAGKVISWTKIHTPPSRFEDETPYFVVLVKMDKGETPDDASLRVGQLVDYEGKIKTGLKVRLVYRRIGKVPEEGVINYGLKFRVLSSQ